MPTIADHGDHIAAYLKFRDLAREPGLHDRTRLRRERHARRIRDRIVAANVGLAYFLASRFVHGGLYDDAKQDALLALTRAVETFEVSYGIPFSAYASLVIQRDVTRGVDATRGIVRMPADVHATHRRLAQVRHTLARDLSREPTDAELAEAACVSVRNVVRDRVVQWNAPRSLDALIGDEDGSATLADVTPDAGAVWADEEVAGAETAGVVSSVLRTLTPREENVMRARYGIGGDARTLAEVGDRMQLSRERIRQIEAKAPSAAARPPPAPW